MIPKNHLKIFKRYLKNKGIYCAFRRAAKLSEKTCVPLKEYISGKYSTVEEIIMSCILWDETKEGGEFWCKHYRDFKKHFLVEYHAII